MTGTGDFGTAVLLPSAAALKWRTPSSTGYGAASWGSIGSDGWVALFGKAAWIFDALSTLKVTIPVSDSVVNDVALQQTAGGVDAAVWTRRHPHLDSV